MRLHQTSATNLCRLVITFIPKLFRFCGRAAKTELGTKGICTLVPRVKHFGNLYTLARIFLLGDLRVAYFITTHFILRYFNLATSTARDNVNKPNHMSMQLEQNIQLHLIFML